MVKKFIVLFLLVVAILIFSEQFKRSIGETIEVFPDGSAIITRTEFVPASDLST